MTERGCDTVRDIEVRTWMELIRALYDIPVTEHGRHRSSFVYRGLADKDWGLDTSLYRLRGNYADVERPMLRSFTKYAEPGTVPSENLWVRLSVAQHHGLPTRVLDWTISPRVAVHFATAEEEHYDKDGAIWCVDVSAIRTVLPPNLRLQLRSERAWLFTIEMLDSVSTWQSFDQLAEKGPFVLFLEPPSLDGRIVNQGAVLSVMPGAELRLNDFLANHENLYQRIIIPSELKWEIRDKLDQDNVTERMLFPGLDGLCRWLKRYYGPGPTDGHALPADQIRKAGP
ncbi:MAG: FRG domain-containing protein [Candidatus Saccharimonadales bacterium]